MGEDLFVHEGARYWKDRIAEEFSNYNVLSTSHMLCNNMQTGAGSAKKSATITVKGDAFTRAPRMKKKRGLI